VTGNVLPFNPLDKKNLGASVAEALIARTALKLASVKAFIGAGIYAIYYSGEFAAYKAIAETNRRSAEAPAAPIYVGKAVPAGSRRGGSQSETSLTKALYSRLMEHADSIGATQLCIDDFSCRYLVVDDIWIPLAESLLIARFAPLWNSLVDGFGNHDPGRGRYAGLRPRWDVLHPGRPWAARCQERLESRETIIRDVAIHLKNFAPPASLHIPELD
jgi:hypothetical protein